MNTAGLAALALGVTLIAGAASASTDGQWVTDERGQTLIANFDNAPYPHASRAEGFTRGDKTYPVAEHYSDSTVAVFLPAGWRDTPAPDIVYFFHGHGNNVRQSLEEAKLREQIVASGKNVVFVLPQGPKNAGDSGCGKLEDPDGLKRLTQEVIDRLHADGKTAATSPGRVVLSGHSGAYKVIGVGLQQGGLEDHIAEVYLLDATYGQFEQYAGWAARHPDAHLRSFFTEHLAPENVQIMAMMDAAGLPIRLTMDTSATDEMLRTTPRLFLYTTTVDHNGARAFLGPWLKTSTLDDIAPPAAASPTP